MTCKGNNYNESIIWNLPRGACVYNGHDRTITVILAKHCIDLPDDGSLVIRNMLEQF